MACNLKERLSLTHGYKISYDGYYQFEIIDPNTWSIMVDLTNTYHFKVRGERFPVEVYVDVNTFLLSDFVPLEIKRIIMFNLDEVKR